MNRQNLFDEFQNRLAGLLRNLPGGSGNSSGGADGTPRSNPAADLEKNLKELFAQTMRKMDLVTRDEFELQREMLQRTRERLEALEARIAELEKK